MMLEIPYKTRSALLDFLSSHNSPKEAIGLPLNLFVRELKDHLALTPRNSAKIDLNMISKSSFIIPLIIVSHLQLAASITNDFFRPKADMDRPKCLRLCNELFS